MGTVTVQAHHRISVERGGPRETRSHVAPGRPRQMLDDGAARAQGPIMKHCLTCVAVPILMAVTSGGLAGTTYRVVPEKSSLRIEVGKGGAFGFVAGHTHEVEGRIQGRVTADARDLSGAEIQLTIRAADLRVSAKGEPPGDVPKVQE